MYIDVQCDRPGLSAWLSPALAVSLVGAGLIALSDWLGDGEMHPAKYALMGLSSFLVIVYIRHRFDAKQAVFDRVLLRLIAGRALAFGVIGLGFSLLDLPGVLGVAIGVCFGAGCVYLGVVPRGREMWIDTHRLDQYSLAELKAALTAARQSNSPSARYIAAEIEARGHSGESR